MLHYLEQKGLSSNIFKEKLSEFIYKTCACYNFYKTILLKTSQIFLQTAVTSASDKKC